MKNLINGTRLLNSMHTDLCAGIRCKNCTMCTDDGGCAVEEWIDRFPSAEQTEPNRSEIPNNCKKCKWWNESYGCHWKEGVCHYVPKAIIPKQCVSCDSASRIIEAYSQGFKDGADAVKAMPQTFTADGIVFAKMDEPQTDCDHKCIQTEVGCERTDCAWK